MTYEVYLQVDPEFQSAAGGVEAAAIAALQQAKAASGALTVVLTDSGTLWALNRRFAGVDAATDVLAFANGSMDLESQLTYYGDVVISVPQAQAQAAQAGHSLDDELVLLAVHGVLHLMGHDHSSQDERERMLSAQAAALKRLGRSIDFTEHQ
ncbi:MAG: rRNA maturation RNase YbeY [Anaerolineales bacterium]|jgi:probable rRNA maturation factor